MSPLPHHKEAVQPEATAATPSGGTRQSYVHIALLPHEHAHAQGGYYLSECLWVYNSVNFKL